MCGNVWRNCQLSFWGKNKASTDKGLCNELHCPSAPDASGLAPQSLSHPNERPQCEARESAAVIVP